MGQGGRGLEQGQVQVTSPTALLRLEGAALLVPSAFLYWHLQGSWIAFALLLLVPDVGMLGYLRGSRLGAATAHGVPGHSSRTHRSPLTRAGSIGV